MAGNAVRRKSRPCVIGVRGSGEVLPVTSDARRRRSDILVMGNSAMAIFARQCGVLPGQREPRRLVLLDHVGDLPRPGRVAPQTVCAELCLVNIRVAG